MGKLEKKTLDEIGKAMVKARALSSRDIDRITANPELFDSVRVRVALAIDKPTSQRPARRTLVATFSSIALVAAASFALVIFKTKPVEVVHLPTPDTTRFTEPDKVGSPDQPRAASPRVERITSKPELKFTRKSESAAQQIRYEGDFYALSYAGDPNETERGGRIVRVDIPRSTLFAMGIDVPLENETESVKADLLIGSDGVTRAIRVVK
ncbi:MAG: hypothetical protein ABI646_03045 [Acidobacteriota bacterium]